MQDAKDQSALESIADVEPDGSIGDYFASLLMRAKMAREKAKNGAKNGQLPTELLLVEITKNANVVIRLTKEVIFNEERRLLAEQSPDLSTRFSFQMMNIDEQSVSSNLASWKIDSVTRSEIKFQLSF